MKRWLFASPLLAFVLLVALLWRGLALDAHAVPSPLIGRPAPAFALAKLDDAHHTVSRDDLLGRVWLLNVWASWCTSCRDEHGALLAFARTHAVPLIGLNYKDERDSGLAWLDRNGNPYAASLFDADGRIGRDFGVYGVPETFVIDRRGVVRYRHVGPLDAQALRTRIEPLLRELDV
jgi:cytochrome c biogenesis protein CcmG/thiol:disulfide interchange protein DsbE